LRTQLKNLLVLSKVCGDSIFEALAYDNALGEGGFGSQISLMQLSL
jgi:hypothetical protein